MEGIMTNHIETKTVIITGAGSGFGRLTALKIAARGARVVCADINAAAALATAEEIRAQNGQALGVTADVTQVEDMRKVAQQAIEAFGAIDVMINNAGIMPLSFIAEHEASLAAWNRCIDINFKGVMNGVAAVHDQMLAQGRGHVINISSIYGNTPTAGAAIYGATKAAIDYFSHALRQESRGKIKVTVVKPTGVMNTGLGATVLDGSAGAGIVGFNQAEFFGAVGKMMSGTAPAEWLDKDNIQYTFLDAEHIADAIVGVIDQPWGVSISDITVRASGDHYIN